MQRVVSNLFILLVFSLLLSACSQDDVDVDALTTIVTLTAEARQTQGLPDISSGTQAHSTPSPTASDSPLDTELPDPGLGAPARLSQLAGVEVLSQDGETLGVLKDLILDLTNKQVVYGILDAGEVLGLGEKSILLPWEVLSIRMEQDLHDLLFYSEVEPNEIAQAPFLEGDDELNFADPDWEMAFRQYWDRVLQTSSPTPTPESQDETPAAVLMLGAHLIGLPVRAEGEEVVGVVEEVLFDLEAAQVQYLVVSAGGVLGIGEKWIPAPASVLMHELGNDGFILLVDREHLVLAPNYDLAQLPDSSDPGWDAEILEYWQGIE